MDNTDSTSYRMELPRSKTDNRRVQLKNLHVQHHSLVEFSFSENLSSSNELTLIRLNSLFERIADRNAMAIRADKLYRIILKTDRNQFTMERYRRVLNIESDEDGKIRGTKGKLRVVSRGPFLAMFKHESITFVNSLECASRSLTSKKKRKNKKKGGGNTKNSKGGTMSSARQTIVSAPIPVVAFDKSSIEKLEKNKSLKRKKIEDKTGMIIDTDKDCCDEISAVSVSPVNATENLKPPVCVNVMDSIQESKSKERKLIKNDSVKNTLSNLKKSVRKPIRSARKSNRSAKKSSRKKSRQRKSHQSSQDSVSSHNRCDSSIESISNIREVMQNTTPRQKKRLKTNNCTPKTEHVCTPSSEKVWIRDDHVSHPAYHGTPYFTPHPYHPQHPQHPHPMMYPMPYLHSYPIPMTAYDKGDDILCNDGNNECSIFSNLASFLKRLIGNVMENKTFNKGNERYNVENANFYHNYQGCPQDNDPANHINTLRTDCRFYQGHPAKQGFNYYTNDQWNLPPVNHFSGHPDSVAQARPCLESNDNLYEQAPQDGRDYYANMNRNNSIGEEMLIPSPGTSYREENFARSRSTCDDNSVYDNIHNSSDKLKVYNFKPSIQLPEPGSCYPKKITEEQPSSKQFSCGQGTINDSSRTRGKQHETSRRSDQNHDTSDKLKVYDFKPSIQLPEPGSCYLHKSTEEQQPFKDGCGPVSVKSMKETCPKTKSDNTRVRLGTNEKKKSPFHSCDSDKIVPSVSRSGIKVETSSEHMCTTKVSKPKCIDQNKESKVTNGGKIRNEVFLKSEEISDHKRSKRNMKAQGQDRAFKASKVLLDRPRPKTIRGSKSLSERRLSMDDSQDETLSMTRGSSVGSAVSSLTGFSDLMPEKSQQRKQNVRYYHYR